MKKNYASKSKAFALGLCSALLFLTSCEKTEVKETPAPITGKTVEQVDQTDLYGLISEREDATGFKTLLDYASPEIRALFNGDTEYTVFVPTDSAWEAFFQHYYGYDSFDDLTIEKRREVVDLLITHSMVKGILLEEDLVQGLTMESVAEQTKKSTTSNNPYAIYIYGSTGATSFNDGPEVAELTEMDLEASNGVIHMVDEIMVPEGVPLTLYRIIVERDDTTIFEEAMKKVGLSEYFRTVTRANAYIPRDEAWQTLFAVLGNDFNSLEDFDTPEELDLLKLILEEHLTKKIFDASPSFDTVLETDTQLVYRETLENSTFALKDATGLITPFRELDIDNRYHFIEAENRSYFRIIHKVLLPKVAVDFFLEHHKNSVLDFIMNLDDLKHISEDITCALTDGLPSFLTDGTPFTLFLPNKESLKELSDTYGDLETQEGREILANIIAYHLFLDQRLDRTDIEFGRAYRTFQSETISFETDGSEISILDSKGEKGATIVSENYQIAGGTIYLIDGLLIPAEISYYAK